jgi:RNA polymerase-binding transcription factor DksA
MSERSFGPVDVLGEERRRIADERAWCEARLLQDIEVAQRELLEEKLRGLSSAAARLAAGLYGYCLDCHRAIEIERLEALPAALRCAVCDAAHREAKRRKLETPV